MSDSNGFIYDPNGINLDVVKDIKEVKRGRIKEYAERVPGNVYTEGQRPWGTKCDIALPCATQNELNEENAKALIANGCKFVAEGALICRPLRKLLQHSRLPAYSSARQRLLTQAA